METVIFTCSLNTQKIRYDAKILQGESAIEPLYKLIYKTSIILSDQDIIKIYKDLNNVIWSVEGGKKEIWLWIEKSPIA